MLKKLTSGFLLAFSLVAFSSCDQVNLDDLRKVIQPAPNPNVVLTAVLSGNQEVPAVNTPATGTFSGVYNKETNVLNYTVTYTGMTPIMGHLHRGMPGMNGPVVVPFSSLTSPITGTYTFTEDDEALLLNNGFYANLHSDKVKSGEIRGNISVQ